MLTVAPLASDRVSGSLKDSIGVRKRECTRTRGFAVSGGERQ